jgi:DNA (cytosine-5)-methyltransferase 1
MSALGVKPIKPRSHVKTGDEALLALDMRAAADYFGVSRNVIAQRTRKNHDKKN